MRRLETPRRHEPEVLQDERTGGPGGAGALGGGGGYPALERVGPVAGLLGPQQVGEERSEGGGSRRP